MKRILSIVTLVAFLLTCIPAWAADEASASEKVMPMHEFAQGEKGVNWSTVKEDGVTYNNGYDIKWTPGEKLGTSNHMAYFTPYNSPVKLKDIIAVNPDTTVNVRYKTTGTFSFGMSFFWYDGGFSSAAGISRNKVTGDSTWQVFSISLAKLLENTSKDLVQTNWDGRTIYLALDNVNPASGGVGAFNGSATDSVYVDSWWFEGVEIEDFQNDDTTLFKEFMKDQKGTFWNTVSVEGVTYNNGYDLVWTPGEKLATTSHLATIATYASPVDIADILDFNSGATLNIRYKTTSPLNFGVSYYWFENGCKGSGGVKRCKVTGDGTWQVFSIPLSEVYAATQVSTATDIASKWNGKTIYLALDNQNAGSFTGSASDSVYVDSWWLGGVDVYDLVEPDITFMGEVTSKDKGSRWTSVCEEGVTWENGYDAKWTPGTNLNTGTWFATIFDYEAPIKLADLSSVNPDATVNVRYKTTSAFNFGMSFYWYENGSMSAGGINRKKVTGDGTWQIYTIKLSDLLASTTASNATGIATNWNGKTMFFGLDNQNAGSFTGSETDSVYVDSWWIEGINAVEVANADSTVLGNFGVSNDGDRWDIVAEDNVTYRNGYDLKWTPGSNKNTTDYLARIANYTSELTFDDILELNPEATVNIRFRTSTPLNFGLTYYWYAAGCSSSGGAIRNKVSGDGSWQVFTKKLSDLVDVANSSANAQTNWNRKSIFIALDNVNPGNVFSGDETDSVYIDSWWIDGINLYNLAKLEKFTYNTQADGSAHITGYTDLLTAEELENLVIPETLGINNEYTVVSVGGFANNSSIKSLVLPETVTKVSASAFYNCTNLTSVTAPGLVEIGNEAFRQTGINRFNSDNEGTVLLPNTITTLGDAAFRACHSIRNIVLSSNITSAGKYVFYRSRGIESIYFPESLTMPADAYYYLYDGYEGLDDVKIYANKNAEVLNYKDDPKAADLYQPKDENGVSDGNMLYANIVYETGDVLVIEENYFDEYGFPVGGTSKISGKKGLTFEGYSYNLSDEDINFKVILTLKSSDTRLKAIGISDASLNARSAGVITCDFELPEGVTIEDKDEIRVILLDSLTNIKPVSSKYNGFTVDTDLIEYNVMAIGNSFAQDSMSNLKAIAKADGIIINSYDCYIGGQTLGGHYERLLADDNKYEILPEGTSSGIKTSINNMLTYRDWDYVFLQGTTHDVRFDESLWNDDTVAWTALTEAVETLAPDAKRYVHATWAPYSEQAVIVQSANPDYIPDDENLDARGDYTKALIPHQEFGAEIFSTEERYDNSGKKAYIPTMVAVDYAIRHFGFDEHTGTLTDSTTHATNKHWDDRSTTGIFRDTTCHLTAYVGRLLAGFVWYEMITGNDVRENPYTNGKLTEEQVANLKEAAHYACTNYATYDPALISAK